MRVGRGDSLLRRRDVEHRLLSASKITSQKLYSFARGTLGASKRLLEYVLYAFDITATLRERAYVTNIGGKLCGVAPSAIEPFALASELIMIAALTSDDVIDRNGMRGNQQSLYAKIGGKQAWLVADAIYELGHICLMRGEGLPVSRRARSSIASAFYSATISLCDGQLDTIRMSASPDISIDAIDRLALARNGFLIGACASAGAILSDRKKSTTYLQRFGESLGIALQHRDDILDFVADPLLMGKPIFQDAYSGQPNLVLTCFFSTYPEGTQLVKSLRRKDRGKYNSVTGQRKLIQALYETGALATAIRHLQDSCARARKWLGQLPDNRFKTELIKLTEIVSDIEITNKLFSEADYSGGYFGASIHVANLGALKPDALVGPMLLGVKSELVSRNALRGLFQQANEPAVFILDELNSLDQDLQGVLLRVLENGEVTPLFSLEVQRVFHLVIGIVNEDPDIVSREVELRDLKQSESFFGKMFGSVLYETLHKARRLRPDLLFRLKRSLFLRMPTLRHRKEDIPILFYNECRAEIKGYLEASGVKKRPGLYVDPQAFELLMRPDLDWPGNVRQLQAVAKATTAKRFAFLRADRLGKEFDEPEISIGHKEVFEALCEHFEHLRRELRVRRANGN